MNSSAVNEKYKTQRCRHFDVQGKCDLGDTCHFAHGDHELRKMTDPIPAEKMGLANKELLTIQKANYSQSKGKYGQNVGGNGYQNGGGYNQNQGYGGNRGGPGKLQYQPKGIATNPTQTTFTVAGAGVMMNNGPGTPPVGGPPVFRQQYAQGGYQRNYNQFQGAGGMRQTGTQFKTVRCKFFDNDKNCPYGDRCTYAHGETELRDQPPMQDFYQDQSQLYQGDQGMYPPQMPMQSNYGGGFLQNFDMMQMQPGSANDILFAAAAAGMGWDQNQQHNMMYGGQNPMSGGFDQTGNPLGMMMPPMMMQGGQQVPVRLNIPFQVQAPDGSSFIQSQTVDIQQNDFSSAEVSQNLQKAITYIQDPTGQNIQEGVSLLMQLQSEGRITIINLNVGGGASSSQGGYYGSPEPVAQTHGHQ